VSSIDASSASKASTLVRRSLAVVKHIPPIVFSIVYRFRTPSVKHDAVVVSACRTARFLHAGRPVSHAGRPAARTPLLRRWLLGTAASRVPTLTVELANALDI